MAHLILKHDTGRVGFREAFGGTWHGRPEYVVLDGPVPLDAVREIFDYPVELRDVFLEDGRQVEGTAAVWRPDIEEVLYPAVGSRYGLMDGGALLDALVQNFFGFAPQSVIGSAGTLRNGWMQFLNVVLDVRQVHGDDSQTVTRFAVMNFMGGRRIFSGLNTIRIVCNNTATAAMAQGEGEGTAMLHRHGSHVVRRVTEHAVDIGSMYGAVDMNATLLDRLARLPMNGKAVTAFLAGWLPDLHVGTATEPLTKRQESANEKRGIERSVVSEIFDRSPDLTAAAHTRYAMFQAVTDHVDHGPRSQVHDAGYVFLDGLTGGRARRKQEALDILSADLTAVA